MSRGTSECPRCSTPVDPEDRFCASCMAPLRQEPETFEPSDSALSACRDLSIDYNVSRVFLENISVPFEFKITVHEDGLSDIRIGLEADRIPGRLETLEECIDANEQYESYLAFQPPPGVWGIIPFKIYIGYRKDDEEHWYITRRKHEVFRAKEKARRVIDSLKIEMNADIEKGQASDGITQRIDNLDALKPLEDDPAIELEGVKLPARWQRLGLKRCQEAPERLLQLPETPLPLPPPPMDAHRTALTLHHGEQRIHLLSGDLIQIGKNRACEIVTRHFGPDGTANKDDNRKISRFHCRVHRDGNTCRLIDRAHNHVEGRTDPSQNGTWLNATRLSRGGDLALPPNQTFTLSLANAFDLEGRVEAEPDADGSPGGLLFRRKDRVRETWVVVWSSIDLKRIDPGFAEGTIYRHQNGFVYNQTQWLIPGMTWDTPAEPVQVTEKQQYYL
ncbi:MAG: FHA domain-containing protein, partial [Verrucomicrobiota bacterium]